jgi:hypothetical protein
MIGHCKLDGEAISDDTFAALEMGDNPTHARTTKGREICIQWQDGSSSWHPLNKIKNPFPVHLAKYVV